MNYQKIYDAVIQKYKENPPNPEKEYCENHHVIPRSFGGTDDPENMVMLPVREHIFCHELLYMHWKHEDYIKAGRMAMALKRFFYGKNVHKNQVRFTSKRIAVIIADAKRLQHELRWITNEKENAQIYKDSPLPEGWRWGMKKNPNKATLWITDGKKNKRIREGIDSVPAGWRIGITHTDGYVPMWITNGIVDKRIRKGDPVPEGWRIGIHLARNDGYKTIHKDGKSKHIRKDQPIPEGWEPGTGINTAIGKIKITDGVQRKIINADEPIPDGWRRGIPKTQRKLFEYHGEILTLKQISDKTGVSSSVLLNNIKRNTGETLEQIADRIAQRRKK